MKKILWIILLHLVSLFSQSKTSGNSVPFAWSFAYVNDNYSATWLNGKSENYIGADDFLTASFLLRIYHQDWKAGFTYNTITSRYFRYRYDLLSTTLARQYTFNLITFQPEIGMLYKGNLSGDDIQNTWHRLRAIHKVHLPYSKKEGFALLTSLNTSLSVPAEFLVRDRLLATLEIRLLSRFVPSRLTPGMVYRTELWQDVVKFEIMTGWRFYLNKSNEYSEMIRPGILTALNLKIKIYLQLNMDFGFSLSPAKNLKEDPLFGNGKFNYLPQMWMAFSWKTPWQSLYDLIDY